MAIKIIPYASASSFLSLRADGVKNCDCDSLNQRKNRLERSFLYEDDKLSYMTYFEPEVSGFWLLSKVYDCFVSLPHEGLVIGRSPHSDIIIHNSLVSMQHLKILQNDANSMLALDLSATNPMKINSQDIVEETLIYHGDVIEAFSLVLRAHIP